MGELILLGLLLGAAYLVVLPILTLIAWSRSNALQEQVQRLARAVDDAHTRIRNLQQALTELKAPTANAVPAAATQPDPAPAAQAAPRPASPPPTPVQPAPPAPATAPAAVPPAPVYPAAPSSIAQPAKPAQAESRQPAVQDSTWGKPVEVAVADSAPPRATAPARPRSAAPAEPDIFTRAIEGARAWLFGGNTIVRIGMLLVFLGLAFLLRYASERVVIPLELRYLAVAASALLGLTLGWRLRSKRPDYALLMQGGAVGVMYLTVFAALKLHAQPLLSTGTGFTLLVAVVLLSGLLAVLQNAMSLAVAGALGGFATPILVSTGGGDHVALFTYFALLNTGILGIAWFKAWRPLNLIGFFGTFLIGLAWGLRSFDPGLHYASAQGFLILFFLMFVGIALLFARRVLLDDPDTPKTQDHAAWLAWLAKKGQGAQRYVDATLLFGVPIVGFGLQYGVVRHIEYGAAFSALALGGFYLLLAWLSHARHPQQLRLLSEIQLALGTIFASLAIPLALDAQWTSAAWAVEGAGIYWIGLRQRRPLARAFALLLQAGAAIAFFSQLDSGINTLLAGSWLGALMLGASFLSNAWQQHRYGELARDAREALYASLGLWALYLTAPLLLNAELTAAAWALAGVVTAFVGLRLRARGWLANALLVQLAAGMLFLAQLDRGIGGVLSLGGDGWKGLVIASLIGACSLASLAQAIRLARSTNDPAHVARLAWATLFGLGFIALAVLFVLPWQTATAVWAVCGALLIWLANHLGLKPVFWFALLLEALAGAAFLHANQATLLFGLHAGLPPEASAFAHAGFWTPVCIALAAFVVAWRMHAVSRLEQNRLEADWLILPALLWSIAWWALAWHTELGWLATSSSAHNHSFLLAMALSSLAALGIVSRWQWPGLTGLCALLLPLIALSALGDYLQGAALLAELGWAGFGAAALACVALLLTARRVLADGLQQTLHLFTTWIWLGVAALLLRHIFLDLGEPGTAWRWLGWTLPLIAWLWWQGRSEPATRWPMATWPQLYRFTATLPVCVVLLGWLSLASLQSAGNAAPLPYLPMVNPLELALMLVLIASWRWLRLLEDENPARCGWQPLHKPLQLAVLAGGFLTYTGLIVRSVHHIGGVPWHKAALLQSMTLQASLSIAWALLALGLMISGHRRAQRSRWIAGAVLVAVVVGKLFFVELAGQGGLARIVSFIGVGVLLLVVGYFAPLPPSREDAA